MKKLAIVIPFVFSVIACVPETPAPVDTAAPVLTGTSLTGMVEVGGNETLTYTFNESVDTSAASYTNNAYCTASNLVNNGSSVNLDIAGIGVGQCDVFLNGVTDSLGNGGGSYEANINIAAAPVRTSCKEILLNTPSSPDGIYSIDPDGSGGAAAFNVYCDMTTDGGGWIDVVRTFTLVSGNATYVGRFFSGLNISVANRISDGEFYFTYGDGSSFNDPIYLDHTVLSGANITEVSLNYVLQGNNTYRCTNSNWLPLNGPGSIGDNSGYAASCPGGRNCIQGSCLTGRDTFITASYNNSSLLSTDLLTWSGASAEGYIATTVDGSCSKSDLIPEWSAAIYFDQLLLR